MACLSLSLQLQNVYDCSLPSTYLSTMSENYHKSCLKPITLFVNIELVSLPISKSSHVLVKRSEGWAYKN